MILRRKHFSARRLAQQLFMHVLAADCILCRSKAPTVDAFCDSCRQNLVQTPAFACQRCGAEVGPYSSTAAGCHHCRKHNLQFNGVTCLGMYRDDLRDAVLSSKWSYSAVGIENLARLLAQTRRTELGAHQADRIIPIPQGWRKRLQRHFDPAACIATVLSQELGIPVDRHILRRRRHTRPQKRVAASRRIENQRNSFRLRDRHVITGQRILLVDDVLTTGATCTEAARVLKRAGAAECSVAVLGRVLDNSA